MQRPVVHKIFFALLAVLLMFSNAFAEEASGSVATADQEWRSYIEPLASIGERTVRMLPDPGDPQMRQELYQFLYSQIATGYMGLVYADPKHPDFWPIFNQVFSQGFPNPDDAYYLTPVDGDGVYKISGFRGTVRMVDFQIGSDRVFTRGTGMLGPTLANYDIDSLHIDKKDGSFQVILSKERPADYKGDWWKLDPKASYVFVRQISYDWLHEVDGRFAIERLDLSAVKPRPKAQEIEANLKQIPLWVENWMKVSQAWVNRVREQAMNKLQVTNYSSSSGLSTQRYIEGIFDLGPDEALIVETEVPARCRYWNFQLADELLRSIDYTNRQSSLNGYTARLDNDGKFRVVVSAQDPGVPNWLDTAGYQRGLVYGRWKECSETPTPAVVKVKVAEVRRYLPANTPVVTAEARDATIRLRRKGLQLRRRW